ncbi:MAG TPA: S24 family peptidase [Thermodesulfobacteriota bacterium]|nr:S24 family peptidase [Thermodesulfobacteriota bacterium]
MAHAIDMPSESPQKIKHHLLQLQKKGFLIIDRAKGMMERTDTKPSWATGLLHKTNLLFSIPIVGTANCGPATIFAEENFQGFLRVSSRLIGRSRPDGLYAVKAGGSSMNRVNINGGSIDDGDYVIIDGNDLTARDKDVVVAIIENKATIKRFIYDKNNYQIVLRSDSSFDYEPIYIHPEDEFRISGKVIGVIKNPKISD